MNTQIIRAVAYQQGDHWIGQCLEFDIATQARTFKDLKTSLIRVIELNFDHSDRHGCDLPPRAPDEFWNRWNSTVRFGSFDHCMIPLTCDFDHLGWPALLVVLKEAS